MKNFDSCLGNGRKEACAIIGLLSQHFKWPNLDHLSRRRPLKSLEPRLLKAACLHSTRALLTQGWKGLACFFFFSLQPQLALQSVLITCKLWCSVFSQRKRKQSRLVVRAFAPLVAYTSFSHGKSIPAAESHCSSAPNLFFGLSLC